LGLDSRRSTTLWQEIDHLIRSMTQPRMQIVQAVGLRENVLWWPDPNGISSPRQSGVDGDLVVGEGLVVALNASWNEGLSFRRDEGSMTRSLSLKHLHVGGIVEMWEQSWKEEGKTVVRTRPHYQEQTNDVLGELDGFASFKFRILKLHHDRLGILNIVNVRLLSRNI